MFHKTRPIGRQIAVNNRESEFVVAELVNSVKSTMPVYIMRICISPRRNARVILPHRFHVDSKPTRKTSDRRSISRKRISMTEYSLPVIKTHAVDACTLRHFTYLPTYMRAISRSDLPPRDESALRYRRGLSNF